MNPFKKLPASIRGILAGVAIGVATITTGWAIGNGLDLWFAPRLLVLQPTTNIYTGGATSITNGPVDIRGLDGIVRIDVVATTNWGNGAGTNQSATIQVYASPDQTNLVALTNFSLVTSNTTFIVTNNYFGANTNYANAVTNGLLATNGLQFPFNRTIPISATAGFATPYLAETGGFAFTNGGAITVSNQGNVSLGFDINAVPGNAGYALRYLYFVFTTGTTSNHWCYSATMLAIPRQP